MNMDMRLMQERLKQDPVYVKMFRAAGLGEPSNGGARRALAVFLDTIVTRGATVDTGRLSAAARRGQALFQGRAGCAACHSGVRFTDDKPHNTGVPDNPEIWADPRRHSAFVAYAKFMGIENYMSPARGSRRLRAHPPAGDPPKLPHPRPCASSSGRRLTCTTACSGHWRRSWISMTPAAGDDPLKDPRLKPLGLTSEEKADLVAFLEALSGETFDTDEFVWRADDYDYKAVGNWRKAPN